MKIAPIVAALIFLFGVENVGAAFLGVELEAGYNGGNPSAIVRTVAPGSPAAAAGFQPGDVVLRVQSENVSTPQEIVARVRGAHAGSRMEMEILRGGKRLMLTATLADAPPAQARAGAAPGQNAGLPREGVTFIAKQSPHCSVLAPADWSFQSNANASTAEALSGDRRMYAGWGVTGINRDQEPYYGALYGPPEDSIRFLAQQVAQQILGDASAVQYTSPAQPFLGYFSLRQLQSARTQGQVFYRIYPGAAGPRTYVESVYLALADKSVGPAGVAVASGVAVSLRCATQLVPTRNEPPRAGKDKGSKPTACGRAEGNLKGYNKELGVQYAHTSDGTNVLMDATTPYENGPDGPGWYARKGNFKEKLQLGRSDDC